MGGYESRRESEVPLTLVSPPLHRKGKEMQYCYLARILKWHRVTTIVKTFERLLSALLHRSWAEHSSLIAMTLSPISTQ